MLVHLWVQWGSSLENLWKGRYILHFPSQGPKRHNIKWNQWSESARLIKKESSLSVSTPGLCQKRPPPPGVFPLLSFPLERALLLCELATEIPTHESLSSPCLPSSSNISSASASDKAYRKPSLLQCERNWTAWTFGYFSESELK